MSFGSRKVSSFLKRVAVVAVGVAAVFAAGGARAATPAELVSNGSFENGLTDWTKGGTVYNYSYSVGWIWISPSLAKLDGVDSMCAMMSYSGSAGTSSIKQTVALGQSGLCLFSCAVAARSCQEGGTFYGATTAVTLDGADEYTLPITNFVTTVHHQHYMERVNAMVSVPDATKVDTLKFATPLTSDRANIVDLVSLKLILPFQAGFCAVGGCQDGENFAYETLQPSVGTVLATNALVALSRTTSAKCLGYRIYRYTAANGYAPAEPEMVAATSHTVTAEDLQSPFRLEWVWQQVDRPIALDTTLFSRKCELTLSGYAGSETLTHFPLLVRLSADSPKGFAYGNAAVGGADLRFTDAEGTVIPHEIDTWNTSGESTVWVRVPAVTGSATKVYLYYGVAAADMKSLPQNVAADVWCEHLGVWHMNVDAVNRITLDSSGSGMTGTVSNVASCDPAAMGVIGGVFTNTSNAGVNFPLSTDVRFLYAPIAFSCWAYDYNCGNFGAIWSGSNWVTFEIIFDGAKTKLLTRPCSSAHVVPTFYRTLRHVQVVYADGKSYVYMDGELAATKDCSVPGFSGLTSIYMACRGSQCNWLGALDEMRIRTQHLTADWIKADYDSQKPNANFVTLGDVEVIKKATLSIADRGYTVDGTTLTMNAYVVPEPGKDAVCRVVYGADGTMSEVTQQKTVTAESDCTETIALDWATAYSAQWQAWSVGDEGKVVTTEAVRFTTDGTPQIASDLVWALTGKVVTVSSELTAKRGSGTVAVSLYRTKDGGSEERIATQAGLDVGTVLLAAETLDWRSDYTYRAVFVSTKEGAGAWTNETQVAVVRVPSEPVPFRAAGFTAHSEITLSGYRGTEQLRDIPVLVRLSAGHPERFDAAACGPNGAYMRFTDELGGLIPHEVDTWNASGESLVWVRVPILKGTGTKITLHMAPGDPARMPSVDSRQVWSEYLGVWHMDVASDWSVKESAASGLDASVKNGYPTACDPTVDPDDPSAYSFTGGAGIVGGSHTNSGWAYVRVPANAAFATLTSNVTFSAWVRSAANQSANPVMWNNMGGGSSFTTLYGTEIYVADAAGTRVGARGSGGTPSEPTVAGITKGAWHYISVAFGGKTFTVYQDDKAGARSGTITPVKFQASDALALGQRVGYRNGSTGEAYDVCNWFGNLDEMRIGRKTESADWAKACYDTVMEADFAVPARVRKTGGLVLIVR